MSDVKAVRYQLAHNNALLAVVPAAQIVAGILPQNTPLPAIGVMHVSALPTRTIAASGATWKVARVQVTVHVSTYQEIRPLLALVRTAVNRSRGTINGVHIDSIAADLEGPDFSDAEATICARSLDFIVRYNE